MKTSEAPTTVVCKLIGNLHTTVLQFSKFNNLLWVCWFLGKNLSNFVSPIWKLLNPDCHNSRSSIMGLNPFRNRNWFLWSRDRKVVFLLNEWVKILILPTGFGHRGPDHLWNFPTNLRIFSHSHYGKKYHWKSPYLLFPFP